MWLHIRGVGEWTNRLYSYFEKEQERLHNGEVPASIPGNDTKTSSMMEATPQKDFLSKNLARLSHGTMIKSSSFENPRNIDNLNGLSLNGNGEKGSTTSLHCEDELQNKENPFIFDLASATPPLRPPRQGPGTSKLATENYPGPPKLERQMSETQTAIRKLQATLQRTFSRKGTTTLGDGASSSGSANDGFVGDDSSELDYKVMPFSPV